MSSGKNGNLVPPKFLENENRWSAGQYADEDWQPEHSDLRCPDCEGRLVFKDWEYDHQYVATHYRCPDCRINWWG